MPPPTALAVASPYAAPAEAPVVRRNSIPADRRRNSASAAASPYAAPAEAPVVRRNSIPTQRRNSIPTERRNSIPAPPQADAVGSSQRKAILAASAVSRMNEMARMRQVLKEQEKERQELFAETQKLQLQYDQLKRLLAKVEASNQPDADPKEVKHYMKKIEAEKLELLKIKAEVAEREAKLATQVEAAKISAKYQKHTREPESEKATLEREIDKWDARLQLDMKRFGELRHQRTKLKLLVDEARGRRVLESQKIDGLRKELGQKKAARQVLVDEAARHDKCAAAAVAELEELRAIAAEERAEFEEDHAAIIAQLREDTDDESIETSDSEDGTLTTAPADGDSPAFERMPSSTGISSSSGASPSRRMLRREVAQEEKRRRASLMGRRQSLRRESAREKFRDTSERARARALQREADKHQRGWEAACEKLGLSTREEVIEAFLELEHVTNQRWARHAELESDCHAATKRVALLRAELDAARVERRRTELSAQERVDQLRERTRACTKESAQLQQQTSQAQAAMDSVARHLGGMMLRLRDDGTLETLGVPQPLGFFDSRLGQAAPTSLAASESASRSCSALQLHSGSPSSAYQSYGLSQTADHLPSPSETPPSLRSGAHGTPESLRSGSVRTPPSVRSSGGGSLWRQTSSSLRRTPTGSRLQPLPTSPPPTEPADPDPVSLPDLDTSRPAAPPPLETAALGEPPSVGTPPPASSVDAAPASPGSSVDRTSPRAAVAFDLSGAPGGGGAFDGSAALESSSFALASGTSSIRALDRMGWGSKGSGAFSSSARRKGGWGSGGALSGGRKEDARRVWSGIGWSEMEVLLGSFEEIMQHTIRCVQYLHARQLLTVETDTVIPSSLVGQLLVKPPPPKAPASRHVVDGDSLPRIVLDDDDYDGPEAARPPAAKDVAARESLRSAPGVARGSLRAATGGDASSEKRPATSGGGHRAGGARGKTNTKSLSQGSLTMAQKAARAQASTQ